MIIYNITTKVNHHVEHAWLQWQQEEYIPEIMRLGLFTAYRIFYLLEQDDTEGGTYIIQYTADGIENYQLYMHSFAPGLRQKALDKWGDQAIAFRSLLEVMH